LASASITPVILCGGSGTWLWPLSSKLFPKLFVPVISIKSLRQHKLELVKQANYIQEV
jgi:mannose-1-phosphate guanylyltransferase